MNWCKPHWDQLKQAVEDNGLSDLIAVSGKEAADNLLSGKYDPLMDSWARINSQMASSPGLHGRILICPCCILEADGQPELVPAWITGALTDSKNYAKEQGLIN